VVAPLGEGGMAAVFQVRHTTLGTLHALKVLTVAQKGVRERLVQEGVLQARLAHPNIVAVTDVLDVDGAPGLLMEFVPGGTLEGLLDGAAPPLHEAERLFRGVLAAVEHAHAHGVIHRDLKPANVLLSPGPAGPTPKVADFGVAKVLDRALATDRKATRAGVAMGSPSYMSPEQIRDAGGVDERSDVFALGCILYELVTGRMAFEGPDVFSIFERITQGTFPPVESVAVDVPARVRAAIHGALQVDPARRIPSCARLREVLDGAVVPAASRPAAAPRSNTALWLLAAAAALVWLVAAVGVGVAWWLKVPAAGEGALIPEVRATPVAVTPTAALAAARVRPLPRCDKLLTCLEALRTGQGPVPDALRSGMPSTLEGLRSMIQLDGMGGFDADEKCEEMWRSYQTAFRGWAEVPEFRSSVPRECPSPGG
jgi:hypothetical protein